MMAAVINITNDEQRQVVRRLLRESGNVNVKTTIVCVLLVFESKRVYVFFYDFKSNQTALMLAVKHEKADLVELLLENGAAVNLQDSDGSNSVNVCC